MRILFLCLLALTSVSSRALAQDAALPRTALTDFERDGQLPDWLALDYDADVAAATDTIPVVARYRAILRAMNALSDARGKKSSRPRAPTDARERSATSWSRDMRESRAPFR